MAPLSDPRANQVPLRRSLVLATFGLALASLLGFAAALYAVVWVPAQDDIARAQLRVASEQVEARVQTLVSRVEAIVSLNRDWGARGLIDPDDTAAFNRLFMPVLMRGPRLSSVVVAHESGRELLLLREPDGRWLNRRTDPVHSPGVAHFQHHDADGREAGSEQRPLDYDARQRPWFRGGMALDGPQAVFWSEPYVFRSSQEPGLSVVVRWTAPRGGRYVMTTDLKLIDLSRFTRDIAVGQRGFVALFTGDGRLLGVPRDARFVDDAAMQAALLQPADAVGVAALSAALAQWRAGGAHDTEALRFPVAGSDWVASLRRVAFGGRMVWVATMAPAADFASTRAQPLLALAAIGLGTLVLAWFVAIGLARRVADPLSRLAERSARIGRLELDQPLDVRSRWTELDALARALEAMRVELLAATRRLADANESLEAKVLERTRDLVAARDAADAGARAKAEFLANMSHEIRTPLNAMLGLTRLALRTELTPRQQGYLVRTQSAANSLLGIVDDILDFSKIEAGRLDLERREFALQDVFDSVTAVVGLKAHEKGLELLFNTAPDVPEHLAGDALRLGQVLVNLCSNAVKFTDQGEIVVVTVRCVDRDDDGVMLRFAVRDTGIGMSEDEVARLFQPFDQLDASTTRKYGGTGLGLVICRQLVTLMGGEIGVASQPGQGSEFHFTARFGAVAHAGARRPPALQPTRVLVCDDSANARAIFEALLVGLGYRPVLVDSGEAALAALDGAGPPFDLLLLDWRMPGMDGFEVVRRLRERDGPRPRIILVTAYGDDALDRRAAAEGLAGCLHKPVSVSTLLDAIGAALGHGGAAPAPAGAQDSDAAPPVLRGRRVLLAEDNELNQLVATELLAEEAGMVVTLASDGQRAVELALTQDFDAVLMDLQMPLLDGFGATARIRAEARLARLPIIAMTAHALVSDRQRCLDAGMNDHVAKPFVPAQLFAALARWMAPAPGTQPPPAHVSFQRGLERCLGRRDLHERVMAQFEQTADADLAALHAAVAATDHDTAARVAHSYVSTAATVGAEALAVRASELQRALDARAPEAGTTLLQAFAAELQAVVTELRARHRA